MLSHEHVCVRTHMQRLQRSNCGGAAGRAGGERPCEASHSGWSLYSDSSLLSVRQPWGCWGVWLTYIGPHLEGIWVKMRSWIWARGWKGPWSCPWFRCLNLFSATASWLSSQFPHQEETGQNQQCDCQKCPWFLLCSSPPPILPIISLSCKRYVYLEHNTHFM